jgi:hypothetical protein
MIADLEPGLRSPANKRQLPCARAGAAKAGAVGAGVGGVKMPGSELLGRGRFVGGAMGSVKGESLQVVQKSVFRRVVDIKIVNTCS